MRTAEALARGLQRLRKQKGFTQAQLAEEAGLSIQMVAGLEQEGRAPSLATIDKVCDALGVRASQLFAAGEPKTVAADEPHERINQLIRDLPRGQQDELVDVVLRISKLVRRVRRR